jgi:hypothetical protein
MDAPLKHERAYKRGKNGQIIANNEYSSEFRAKYFLYRTARYAALTGEHRKDFGWYTRLTTMWPEWLKEGLTEITQIPTRMELDYLYRMRPTIDSELTKTDETIPKIPRRLLGAFNRTDEVAVPVPASALSHRHIVRGSSPERRRGRGGGCPC